MMDARIRAQNVSRVLRKAGIRTVHPAARRQGIKVKQSGNDQVRVVVSFDYPYPSIPYVVEDLIEVLTEAGYVVSFDYPYSNVLAHLYVAKPDKE